MKGTIRPDAAIEINADGPVAQDEAYAVRRALTYAFASFLS
jgi:hypothetical protein